MLEKRQNTRILHFLKDDDVSPGFTKKVVIGSIMLGVVPRGSGVQVGLQGFGVTDSG
jgi:hypothetical protein